MYVRSQSGLGDRRRICGVVLLALDERLHVNWRNEPDLMAEALRYPTPIMARSAGFHRDDAGRLLAQ